MSAATPGHWRPIVTEMTSGRRLARLRLLPKSKSVGRQLGFTKRKAIMPKREADRLFAGTMRTQNRSLRDLLLTKSNSSATACPFRKLSPTSPKRLAFLNQSFGFLAFTARVNGNRITSRLPFVNGPVANG
jgi:hypothetical protein